MATVDFVIKKGDVRPVLSSTLTYADGSSVNLTGATVRFVMRAQTAISPTTNAAATITTATGESHRSRPTFGGDQLFQGAGGAHTPLTIDGSWRVFTGYEQPHRP